MQGVAKVEQFWWIVLCKVFFKIVTKILAGRLRPVLMDIIHLNQSAFIPQRSISDNIIIDHELMHYMNGKKGKSEFIAIKIDLAKAYDRVEWGTLNVIMRNIGFDDDFCNMIDNCISTVTFSILLNGAPIGYFKAERGLQQHEPMLRALFTILSDLLSRMINKVSQTSPKISHLMYADNLVIYGKATT